MPPIQRIKWALFLLPTHLPGLIRDHESISQTRSAVAQSFHRVLSPRSWKRASTPATGHESCLWWPASCYMCVQSLLLPRGSLLFIGLSFKTPFTDPLLFFLVFSCSQNQHVFSLSKHVGMWAFQILILFWVLCTVIIIWYGTVIFFHFMFAVQ